MRSPLTIAWPSLLLLAALGEVTLRVLIVDLQVGDFIVVDHLRLVVSLCRLHAHSAMHLLLLNLFVPLGNHLIDELGGLRLVLSVTSWILVCYAHGRNVLPLPRG